MSGGAGGGDNDRGDAKGGGGGGLLAQAQEVQIRGEGDVVVRFHVVRKGTTAGPRANMPGPAFLEMGTPANKTELVRWLGVAGSLRAGVPYFSHLASPLHKRKHRKEPRLALTEEYEQDLEAL